MDQGHQQGPPLPTHLVEEEGEHMRTYGHPHELGHINDIGPVKDLVDKCLWKSGHVG